MCERRAGWTGREDCGLGSGGQASKERINPRSFHNRLGQLFAKGEAIGGGWEGGEKVERGIHRVPQRERGEMEVVYCGEPVSCEGLMGALYGPTRNDVRRGGGRGGGAEG